MATPAPETHARPRVEGAREQEILHATLSVLAEVGYDRLTMDAVAQRARASKATLYRRFNGKLALVIDALVATKGTSFLPDTGTLRGDLLASYCAPGGLADGSVAEVLASVVTAMTHDPEFAEAFRTQVIGPKLANTAALYRRAQARGEIRADVDIELAASAVAGIVLHRNVLLGEPPTPELIARVLDDLILPALTQRKTVK